MAKKRNTRHSWIKDHTAEVAVAFASEHVDTAFIFEDMLIVQMALGSSTDSLIELIGKPVEEREGPFTGPVAFWWLSPD